MNRPLCLAAFLLLAVSVELSAQHGGAHGSVAGHVGMAGHSGFAGHSAGPAFGGVRAGSGFAGHSSSGGHVFNRPLSARGFNHSTHSWPRSYGFRNNCYGYGCRGVYGYPWWYVGAFDPYWWWDSGSAYDADREREIGLANEMNAQSLNEQRRREPDDQAAYAVPAPSSPHQEERSDALPATVLVFRDQHQQEIQNYAIVGQTLWNFAPRRTQKIPLSELDLPATSKANDERGVGFRVPGSHEGQ